MGLWRGAWDAGAAIRRPQPAQQQLVLRLLALLSVSEVLRVREDTTPYFVAHFLAISVLALLSLPSEVG